MDSKSADVNPENIIPITVDKLTSEQKAELEDIMNKLQNQYLRSFVQTRSGIVVQRYKVTLPNNEDPESSSGKDKEVKQEETHEEPKNLQDRIDYAVHNTLINQSGVLINTSTNMIKFVVDGMIAEHQTKGPIFLPEGVFPQYRTLITDKHHPVSNMAPEQPIASTSALRKQDVSASAQKHSRFNPDVLFRQQPQHSGQNIPQVTSEHVSAMFGPNQPVVQPILQSPIKQQAPIS